MTTPESKAAKLREVGWNDAKSGKRIEAFYDVPRIRHSESNRAEYEIGYREGKKEVMRFERSMATHKCLFHETCLICNPALR